MDPDLTEVEQRALSSRLEKSRLQDRAQSARKESCSLKEYSRRRFQTVVDLETKSSPRPASPPSSPPGRQVPKIQLTSRPKTTAGNFQQRLSKTYPQAPTTPTNGPTKNGSILYNGKPFLLSSIRTRPKSEPPSRFDHLRGTFSHYPDIQRTLEQSNCEYRVGPSGCQTAREARTRSPPPLSPDFVMLIPVTSVASESIPDDASDVSVRSAEWQQELAWAAKEQPTMVSTERSRSPGSEELAEEKAGQEGEPFNAERDQEARPNSTSPPDIPLLSLVDATPEPPQAGPAQSPDGEQPLTRKSSSLLSVPGAVSKKRPSSGSKRRVIYRPNSARSDSSSLSSTVSYSPRPHCWVDDVTISSDDSQTDRDLALQNDLDDKASVCSEDRVTVKDQVQGLSPGQVQRGGSPSGDRKKVVNIPKRSGAPQAKRVLSANKANKLAKHSDVSVAKDVEAKAPAAPAELSAVVEAGKKEEEEQEPVLPRLLCPSSESKSRQAAIKEWLAKSSFSTACRTVPLM